MTGLSFSSPYNPSCPRRIWSEAPKSFSVYGSKDSRCWGPGGWTAATQWWPLLYVPETYFTGPDQNMRWNIPCDNQDSYQCYLILTHENSGHGCNCVSISKLKWYYS